MKDGKQGISHDRVLMRIKDYIQIVTSIGVILWGGIHLIQKLDEINAKLLQVPIMQQQISRLEQLVVNAKR